MSRLFVGNFDFEWKLAAGDASEPPSLVRRIVAELASAWLAIAEADDVVWCPQVIDPEFFERGHRDGLPRVRFVSAASQIPAGLELVPWGWTEQIVHWRETVNAIMNHPPVDAVKAVNSRQFSQRFEQDRGVALPGTAEVRSVDQLIESIERLSDVDLGFVVKAEYGNSSRERFFHRGRQTPEDRKLASVRDSSLRSSPIDGGETDVRGLPQMKDDRERLIRWARRRLLMGQLLYVEPWVERVDEAGVQITVPHNGNPTVEGVTRLIVDEQGRYRGSQFAPLLDEDPDWQDAIEIALEVAAAARKIGYFGPLGIDAMRYRDTEGTVRLRPVQDVNARWTMGRLSLGFRRFISTSETGIWRHEAVATSSHEHASQQQAKREIVTSPETVGGTPALHRAVLQITDHS